MFRNAFILAFVFFLLLQGCGFDSCEEEETVLDAVATEADKKERLLSRTFGNGNWIVCIEDGKSDPKVVDLEYSGAPLDRLRENLSRIHPWDFGQGSETNPEELNAKLEKPEVSKIGPWEGFHVYDVTDKENRLKQIILQDYSGECRILYSQIRFCPAGVGDFPTTDRIDGREFLIYRTQISGTGCFFIEHYFLYDEIGEKVVELDVSAIEVTLKEILPDGHGVWKGGGFDLKELKFEHSVWKKGDGNCRPTGGSVAIKFEVVGFKLVTVDKQYLESSE